MTPEELRAELTDALGRRPDAERGDMVWTFVAPGPHGLPVRPSILSHSLNGERVYGLKKFQAEKLLNLLVTA